MSLITLPNYITVTSLSIHITRKYSAIISVTFFFFPGLFFLKGFALILAGTVSFVHHTELGELLAIIIFFPLQIYLFIFFF